MTTSISINSFSLDLKGLCVNYSIGAETTTLKLDPSATCDLFQNAGLIEGFDHDQNGEPVVLFEQCRDMEDDRGHWIVRRTTGHDLWHSFCQTFAVCKRTLEILIEIKLNQVQHRKTMMTIHRLLLPVKGAA